MLARTPRSFEDGREPCLNRTVPYDVGFQKCCVRDWSQVAATWQRIGKHVGTGDRGRMQPGCNDPASLSHTCRKRGGNGSRRVIHFS